ncbi:MAG: hypothetical protein K2F87_03795, partial [Muribaculaceae bacterium]|nr:hypothetical protein [Muribaculaceae bacterium]
MMKSLRRMLAVGLVAMAAGSVAEAHEPCCGQVAGEAYRALCPSRPVTGIYSFELGRSGVVARYLAPVRYAGAGLALAGRWIKAMPFAPERALMEFDARVDGAWSLLN